MTRDQVLQLIEKEFAVADQALKIGNDGKVRVCARRAAGAAIAYWLQSNPRSGWGLDAMTRLHHLQLDASLPHNVRDAAVRLTTKITEQFATSFATSPIEDSRIIIAYLIGLT
jgi:hypothetical protein